MRNRALFAVGLAALTAAGAACSAIIGTRDLVLEASDGGGVVGPDGSVSEPDGATGSTGPSNDATTSNDGAQTTNEGGGGSDAPTGDATCNTSDLQGDKLNCGVCGHSCLGGDCTGGVCQPISLVIGQFGASGIVADANNIYWTTTSTPQVLRANKDGTGLVVLATSSAWYPLNVAIDNANAYWVDDTGGTGSIFRCGKTGCDAGPTRITPATLDHPSTLRSDGQNVYWSEYFNNAVGRVKIDGGAFGYLATQLDYSDAVEVDDASVFFGTYDTVGRVPKGAPGVTDPEGDAAVAFTTIASESYVFGLSADATNLYWALNADPGTVQFIAKGATNGTAQNLSAAEHFPVLTALDDANVYWTAQGPDSSPSTADYQTFLSGYVATCPKTGCPSTGPRILASNLHAPYGIAVDDTAVYFTVHGNIDDTHLEPTEGLVMKVAK